MRYWESSQLGVLDGHQPLIVPHLLQDNENKLVEVIYYPKRENWCIVPGIVYQGKCYRFLQTANQQGDSQLTLQALNTASIVDVLGLPDSSFGSLEVTAAHLLRWQGIGPGQVNIIVKRDEFIP